MSIMFISQHATNDDYIKEPALTDDYDHIEFRINNLTIKLADDKRIPENLLFAANEDKSVYAFMLGEIYGTEKILNSLREKGHKLKNGSDVEFIVHLYEEYGENQLKNLNGKFTILLTDIKNKKSLLINDRYGFYNFYYVNINGKLILCNIPYVLIDYLEDKIINEDSAAEFFNFGYILGDKTLIKDLNRLEPATYMLISDNSFIAERYWEWSNIDKDCSYSFDEAVDKLGELWINAVNRIVCKHEKYYLPLSGGLDSRAILAAMDYLGLNHKLILSYTFGKKHCLDNYIAGLASSVAGVKHEFIELTGDYWWSAVCEEHCNKLLIGAISLMHCHGVASKETGLKHTYLNGFLGDVVLGGSYLDERYSGCNRDDLFSTLQKNISCAGIYGKGLLNNFIYKKLDTYDVKLDSNSTDFFYINYGRARNFVNNGTSVLGDNFYQAFPFFDNDLIDFIYSLPNEWRINSKIYISMLLKYFPKFFRSIPWQKTKLPINCSRSKRKVTRITVPTGRNRNITYRIKKYPADAVIFGASTKGMEHYKKLRLKYNVIYFCDNDPQKWGKKIKGLEIIPPCRLSELSGVKVFVSSMYYHDIIQQLLNMGIKRYAVIDLNFDYDDSYIDYDNWIREDNIKTGIYEILLSERCRSRGYYNINKVKETLDAHMDRSIDASKDIGLLLTFEMFCRTYLD